MEPTRNNRGVAYENGSIESAHGHLERAIQDALLLRGCHGLRGPEDLKTGALRKKPMALLNLVYRDQLFPREVYGCTFERLRERAARRLMVGLLRLRPSAPAKRAWLWCSPSVWRQTSCLISMRFSPDPARLPVVLVNLSPLSAYETLAQGNLGEAA